MQHILWSNRRYSCLCVAGLAGSGRQRQRQRQISAAAAVGTEWAGTGGQMLDEGQGAGKRRWIQVCTRRAALLALGLCWEWVGQRASFSGPICVPDHHGCHCRLSFIAATRDFLLRTQ